MGYCVVFQFLSLGGGGRTQNNSLTHQEERHRPRRYSSSPNGGVSETTAADDRSPTVAPATMSKKMKLKSNKAVGGSLPFEDEKWYHGRLHRLDCEAMLHEEGDWLLRKTEIVDEERHVISMMGKGKPIHIPICEVGRKVKVGEGDSTQFDGIQQLVEHHTTTEHHPLTKTTGSPLMLKAVYRQGDNHGSCVARTSRSDSYWAKERLEKCMKSDEGTLKRNRKKTICAVKRPLSTTKMTKGQLADSMKEMRIMKLCDHVNLVHQYGVVTDHEPILFVVELVDGGGLDAYLKKRKLNSDETPKAWKCKFCLDAAEGVEYLHDKKKTPGFSMPKLPHHRQYDRKDKRFRSVNPGDGLHDETWKGCDQVAGARISTAAARVLECVGRVVVCRHDVEDVSQRQEPYPKIEPLTMLANFLTGTCLMDLKTDKYVIGDGRQIMEDCWDYNASKRPSMAEIRRRLQVMHKKRPPKNRRNKF